LASEISCAVIGLDGFIVYVKVDYCQGLLHMPLLACRMQLCRKAGSTFSHLLKNTGLIYPAWN
jgi:hypothetical protein